MKLFGKEVSKSVLAYEMRYMNQEQVGAIMTNLALDREDAAKARMLREKDLATKERMKQLIARREFNFDVIFGPEK